jgi:serralysin
MPIFPGTPGDDLLYGTDDDDTITGLDGNDTMFGFGGNDMLDGGLGSDILDGGTGADIMSGGGGNDAFYVDNAGDIVRDFVVGGNDGGNADIIFTTVNFLMGHDKGEYVERLMVLDPRSTTNILLVGNNLDNEITGNDGQNRIIGAGGADLLMGLGGDDSYIIDQFDTVVEFANQGYDFVRVGFSYTLPDNVEQLVYDNSSASATLVGNASDNSILAREVTGALIIDGGAGADTMSGGRGNDTYYVDNIGDVVDESFLGGGSDQIWTKVDYTLLRDIERLRVDGATTTNAVNLTGNEFANELWGNDGANVLDGKLGRDILVGYGGADTFAFTTVVDGHNADLFVTFEVGIDKIALDDAVFAGLTAGALAASAFTVGRFASDADDRILYESATGNLFFDRDGTGPLAAQFFATLGDGLNLAASDFVVI